MQLPSHAKITVEGASLQDVFTYIRDVFREEILSAQLSPLNTPQLPDLGGIELAEEITGFARQTIYGHVSAKTIPFNKPEGSKKLYFSRKELTAWIKEGRGKTIYDIQAEADYFLSTHKSR